MIRKFFALVIVIAALGAGYYFFIMDKKSAQSEQGNLAGYTPPPMEGSAEQKASAPSSAQGGEFWTKRCSEEGDKHCEVFQRLVTQKTEQRVLELAVGYPKDLKGQAQAVMILPLGILVSEGVGLLVDGGTPAKSAIRTCGAGGCVVLMELPESFVDVMKSGKKLTVAFIDSNNNKQVNIDLPLDGFAERLAEVKP